MTPDAHELERLGEARDHATDSELRRIPPVRRVELGAVEQCAFIVDAHPVRGLRTGPVGLPQNLVLHSAFGGHDILTGRYACYDTYAARDGRWLAIGAIEPRFFANLCKALGCEQWTSRQLEEGVQDEMRADFQARIASRDRDDWVAELAPSETCVSPVYDVGELAGDPQFRARGAFSRVEHPTEGGFEQLAPPFAGMHRSQAAVAVRDAAVTDTESLLAEAGLPAGEIERLRADGVIA